jgi:hypothetical protein
VPLTIHHADGDANEGTAGKNAIADAVQFLPVAELDEWR